MIKTLTTSELQYKSRDRSVQKLNTVCHRVKTFLPKQYSRQRRYFASSGCPALIVGQYGFSATSQLLVMLYRMYYTVLTTANEHTNNNEYTDLILLDFKKAFDTVSRLILLYKLYGTTEIVVSKANFFNLFCQIIFSLFLTTTRHLISEVESLWTSLPSRTTSRTHFEALGLEGQVLGLEASSPRKLPCPRLENSTIF